MLLFIDTNIFLSFFHFSNDDLGELEKLAILSETDGLNLLLPVQVIDEFLRNRDNKINDALKGIKTQKLNIQFPQICKDYEEYEQLRKLQKEYEVTHSELIKKLDKNVKEKSLKADEIVNRLFDSATILEIKKDLINKARVRIELGNPPGKNRSLGDAVNWEALLDNISEHNDLYFITDDKDYFSSLDNNSFNDFLLNEWGSRMSSELICYKKLSDFLKENFPDINLSGEYEKEILIQGLATSSNFTKTHQLVSSLLRFSDFTNAQVNEIISATLSNNQVYWIINDEDVSSFINRILDKYSEVIDPENLKIIKEYLSTQEDKNTEEVDSLPF